MFGKKNNDKSTDSTELDKIKDRLDSDENIIMHVKQSRIRPGGASILTPNTLFLTEKRVIIRNPTRLGFGENIEEYHYHQITNIKLENGIFSSSLIFAIPGMTEISKMDRKYMMWGRDSEGVIDAIPKEQAEKMYEYIRQKISEAKTKESKLGNNIFDDPLEILKNRYAKGEITEEEFKKIKKNLE